MTTPGGSCRGGRADAAILDAPSYPHLVYRPAVPLVASTLVAGRVESADA
jgi:imidazolonepropionase